MPTGGGTGTGDGGGGSGGTGGGGTTDPPCNGVNIGGRLLPCNGLGWEPDPYYNPVYLEGNTYTRTNYPGLSDGFPWKWWEDDNWLETYFRPVINKYELYRQLSDQEKQFVRNHPFAADEFRKNAHTANLETESRFPDIRTLTNPKPYVNTRADAFRHAYWTGLNRLSGTTEAGGYFNALEFGTAHESEVPYLLYQEKDMDLFNNETGLIITNNHKDRNTLADAVYQQVVNGNMKYLKDLDYVQSPEYSPSCTECRNGFLPGHTTYVPTNQ